MSTPPKDPNYLIKLENAIIEKYGELTVKNPKADWTIEQEKEYLSQIKKIYRNKETVSPIKKTYINGVLLPEELINKSSDRVCTICNIYSFNIQDDLYMLKFKSCKMCYIKHIEGRNKWHQFMK